MINTNMRVYNFSTIGTELDAYGQPIAASAQGTIKMDINITSQSTQDNIKYKDCTYVGLTMDNKVDDTYIIHYGDNKLKVMYVNPKGRYNQVFMSEML